ncbi:MAG: hypothetical protein RR412_08690 [Burkholderiaceae bacterium]
MTRKRWDLAGLVATAGLLAGCANSFHDSYVVGDRWFQTRLDTYPTLILGIDGSDTLQRRVLVSPGEHVIRVQGPGVASMQGETREIKLLIEPCYTYYIVAVKANALAMDFTPKLDYRDPLAGCTPPPGWDKK